MNEHEKIGSNKVPGNTEPKNMVSEDIIKSPLEIEGVQIPYTLLHPETLDLARELVTKPEVREHLQFLKEHHIDSYEHGLRVGVLSIDVGLDRGFSADNLSTIGMGGLLHDLGKCDILEELLSGENNTLSDEEKLVMQEHTRYGFERLSNPIFDEVRKIVVAHHEFKTSPYPRTGTERRSHEHDHSEDPRQNNERTLTYTEIVAVADIFDALASQRSYKTAFPFEKIESILREQFTGDPKLIDLILKRFS